MPEPDSNTTETATLGAGCFWCIEAVLQRVPGIVSIEPGYMGGHVPQPTYDQVCSGRSGHAEVARIRFDPRVLPYAALLEWFWKLHDPTTRNRQGNDIGPQYRSAIFYHNEKQRVAAEHSICEAGSEFDSPIVTEIQSAGEFYPAEEYHREYYVRNPNVAYCRYVIRPKLEKFGFA